MTPTHTKLVDDLLQQFLDRTIEHTEACGFLMEHPPSPVTLRRSPIGQHLIAIVDYGEGHPYRLDHEDVRASIAVVKRAFFGDPTSKGFRLPPKFHLTPLGDLINDALLRFYLEQGPGQLLAIGVLRERFGVKRQTVHLWIEQGLITPAYLKNGETRFYLLDVEHLQQIRGPKDNIH